MPKWCVVPNCKSGSRTEPKRSVFRVPQGTRHTFMRKKWEEVIPGIIKLQSADLVCEKHFNKEDISREWVKLDANGQVIARVAYKHPRLNKLAVPTRFGDCLAETENCVPLLHEYALRVSDPQSHAQSNANRCDVVADSSSLTKSLSEAIDIAPPTSIIDTNIGLSIHPIEVSNLKSPEADSVVPQKATEVPSSLKNNEQILTKNANISEDFSGYVPKRWSWVEMRTEIVQHMLFTFSVTKIRDGENCPVTQKSVTLNVDNTLKYFVYGHHVDTRDKNLERVLEKKEMLPDVLNKFKGMNICNGLGDISIYLVPADNAYQDYVDEWRSKDCSLLSKKKRCDFCIKIKTRILQRAARLKNPSKITRIGTISNPVERRKLLAMRLKIRRERCQKLRAKNRVKQLITCIKAQQAKIASMEKETQDTEVDGAISVISMEYIYV